MLPNASEHLQHLRKITILVDLICQRVIWSLRIKKNHPPLRLRRGVVPVRLVAVVRRRAVRGLDAHPAAPVRARLGAHHALQRRRGQGLLPATARQGAVRRVVQVAGAHGRAAAVTLLNPFTGTRVEVPPADDDVAAASLMLVSMKDVGRWVLRRLRERGRRCVFDVNQAESLQVP